MRLYPLLAAAAALAVFASPAAAQDRQDRRSMSQRAGAQSTALAQAVSQGQDQPDVLLDIPNLSVDEINLEVNNLQVHIALDARLANLLKLTAGADASIDQVKIGIKGVQATGDPRSSGSTMSGRSSSVRSRRSTTIPSW